MNNIVAFPGIRITVSDGWLEGADLDDSGILVSVPYTGPDPDIAEEVIWTGSDHEEALKAAYAYQLEHPGSRVVDECDLAVPFLPG